MSGIQAEVKVESFKGEIVVKIICPQFAFDKLHKELLELMDVDGADVGGKGGVGREWKEAEIYAAREIQFPGKLTACAPLPTRTTLCPHGVRHSPLPGR